MDTIGVSTLIGRRTILKAGAAMGMLPMALTACAQPVRSGGILAPANCLVSPNDLTRSAPWYWDGPGSTTAVNIPTPISSTGGPFSGSAYQLTSSAAPATLGQTCNNATIQRYLQQNVVLSSSLYVHSSFAGQLEISLVMIDMSTGAPTALHNVPAIYEQQGAPNPGQQACIVATTCGYSQPDSKGWQRFWVNGQLPAPMGTMQPLFTFQFDMSLSSGATGPVFGPQVAIVASLTTPPPLYQV